MLSKAVKALLAFGILQFSNSVHKVEEAEGKLWVLLVAGSRGWYNYRHQADLCHAYQVVHRHGVPDENIVVMMADDIAYNELNPNPGVIINRPNGPNVYAGVPKDYTGDDNNPDVFLRVLRGQKVNVGSGKVIDSGPNDRIFVYFTDHGGRGILGFGDQYLKATDLNDALMEMYFQDRFKKMVMYIEACESGSMFEGLLSNKIGIFASTASNSTASSFACYFDNYLKTYLGDVYSIKWLQDSDWEDLGKETIENQYEIVKEETQTSTVMKFGDFSIGDLPVSEFQGPREPTSNKRIIQDDDGCKAHNSVPSFDVPLKIAKKTRSHEELRALLVGRRFLVTKIREIVKKVTKTKRSYRLAFVDLSGRTTGGTALVNHAKCYYDSLESFHINCFNLGQNDFAMRYLYLFLNLCEFGHDRYRIITAIKETCNFRMNITGIF